MATSRHATYEAQESHADGSEHHVSVSGRTTSSAAVANGPSGSTHEISASSSSRRVVAGGYEHETVSGSARSIKTGEQTKHEASATHNTTAADGRYREIGASARVGEQPGAGEQRTIVAKVGQVTGQNGVAEKGDGVIVKRGANGDLSSKVVTSGENRTRSLTVGDQTTRQGLLARFKSGVVGEKNAAPTAFEKGVPVSE